MIVPSRQPVTTRRCSKMDPGHPAASSQLAKLERHVEPASADDRLQALISKEHPRPGHVALWYLESDDESAALMWLERAIEQRDPTVLYFRFDERWEELRADPRYVRAMARAGISVRS